ncbi:lantibiotic dehydratase [Archangium lansingense]|uniref:Lantibiotic dehydratase n=1 Tax=Archangium lansingense TaxID=2995310 RepID=A0ABT4AFZ6_9BACT|nr:lantibiotic dehydratase [Archangium lansinium]MCY1080610.1 lantibiotic dehydratase [Archangium lansinium]
MSKATSAPHPEWRQPFRPSGFFALRTPLLPLDEWSSWSAEARAPLAVAGAADDLEAIVAADRVRLRARLWELLDRPEVREALFLATPDLFSQMDSWLQAPDSKRGQKVEQALVRYFTRMAARPTPFGLFAGCSVGRVAQESTLALHPREANRRHTRLDMDYLFALAEALTQDRALRGHLTFWPNSTLYRAAGRLRYAEARLSGRTRTYRLVAVKATEYLEEVLRQASAGARLAELVETLVRRDPEVTPEEAEAFVHELVDSQLLVSELLPGVTGPEAIHHLIGTLSARPETLAMAHRLEEVRALLARTDEAGPGADPRRYLEISASLAELPAKVELPRLFQVDMVKPAADLRLGPEVVRELAKGVQLLHRLARPRGEDELARFRAAFLARYEDREVPLAEALDEESGIGFGSASELDRDPSPLLDGLPFPAVAESSAPWDTRQDVLLRKLSEALRSGATRIELTEQDLAQMASSIEPPPLPDALAVMASLAAQSPEAVARGQFQVLIHAVTGPSGARLLGRFCHADPELHRQVASHLAEEEALRPGALFAEIVHLPEGRVGNVTARPVLRRYELPYLGRPAVEAAEQIPLTDLLISVVGERVVLRSARLGQEVLPRLSTAHAYGHRNLGPYRLLCSLQGQETANGLAFGWGPLGNAPFLPRVVHGRLVLSRARWHVTGEELRALGASSGGARLTAVRAWRERRGLPRLVVLSDFDNELPVDLENILSVDAFVDLVKKRPQATLLELFPGPEEQLARGPEGQYVHELVMPFVRSGASVARAPGLRPPRASSRPSSSPGSDWLYAKLYCGNATADEVLRAVVRPVTALALEAGIADSWFFIRYADPAWHLRLRLHGDAARLLGEVIPALREKVAPLLAGGLLRTWQLDTYESELDRYGGPTGLPLAEAIFFADSEAALAIVETLSGDEGADARWRLALLGAHRLLVDLGLDAAARSRVSAGCRDRFAAEFRVDGRFRGAVGDRFRRERPTLEELLDPELSSGHWLASGAAILRRRSEQMGPVCRALREAEQAGRLDQPIEALAPSLLHMHLNRLLRSAQRAHEVVLYDLLARHYESQAHRLSSRFGDNASAHRPVGTEARVCSEALQ